MYTTTCVFLLQVPSDITILEHTYSKNNKKKNIFFLKKLFIRCSFFTIGNKCNKLNSSDVIKVLSNVYSGNIAFGIYRKYMYIFVQAYVEYSSI